jgi:hypothetical protein
MITPRFHPIIRRMTVSLRGQHALADLLELVARELRAGTVEDISIVSIGGQQTRAVITLVTETAAEAIAAENGDDVLLDG